MELNNLTPAAGSVKTAKRIGRGAGSGLGGTSTRGHKGAKSRSGYSNLLRIARTRFCTLMTTGRGSTESRTGTTTDTFCGFYRTSSRS